MAQTCTPQWSGEFINRAQGGNGLGFPVYDIKPYQGRPVAVGDFERAGPVSADRVAMYQPTGWVSLSNKTDFVVKTALPMGQNLIVGGAFTLMDNQPADRVAIYNGTSWSAMGAGFPGLGTEVDTLIDLSGTIVAGGVFSLGGQPAGTGNVAFWNGSAWQAMGAGTDGPVYASVIHGGQLIIGGAFANADGVAVNGLAVWNGTSWQAFAGGGLGAGGGEVHALLSDGTNLYVGGTMPGGAGVSAGVRMWDGSAWQSLGAGVDPPNVLALAKFNGLVYVGGNFLTVDGQATTNLAAWDGTAWVTAGLGAGATVHALSTFNESTFPTIHLYAGGEFENVGGTLAYYMNRYGCSVASCYANCDGSVGSPVLSASDFVCFLQKFRSGDPSANCDNSTASPVLSAADFTCFLQQFRAGCP